MSTAFMTETQDRTPRDWMALVTTLLQSIRQISPGLGILLGGVLAAAGSSRAAFGVAGAGCLLFAGATFVLLSPKRMEGGVPSATDPLADRAPTRRSPTPYRVVAAPRERRATASEMTISA